MNPQQNNEVPDSTTDNASYQPEGFGSEQSASRPPEPTVDPIVAPAQRPMIDSHETEAITTPASVVTPGIFGDAAAKPTMPPQVFGPQQTAQPMSSAPSGISNMGQSNAPGGVQQTQTTYASPLSDKPKRRLPSKKLLVVLVAILAVGLGGSAFAYINIMNNSPEKVLADALANTTKDILDRKPLQFVSNIKLESKEQSMPYTVVVDLDAKQLKENGEFNTTVRVKVGSQLDLSVSGSMIVEGTKAVYVRVNDLQKTADEVVRMNPELASHVTAFKPLLQKIEGQWIKIDEESLASYGLTESKEEIDKCAEAFEGLRISDSDKSRIKEIFKKNQFAIASEELPAETIDGDSSFHYKLDLNEEASIRFAKDFVELDSFSNVKSACKIKQEDIDKELDNLRKNTDTEEVPKPIFELWVSKKNRYPTKLKVTLDDKEASMEWVTNTKINAQNLKIDIPTDTMSIEELKNEIETTLQAEASQGMTRGWSSWRQLEN